MALQDYWLLATPASTWMHLSGNMGFPHHYLEICLTNGWKRGESGGWRKGREYVRNNGLIQYLVGQYLVGQYIVGQYIVGQYIVGQYIFRHFYTVHYEVLHYCRVYYEAFHYCTVNYEVLDY